MRIVIAEDSAVVRAGLVEILADRGLEVVAAVGNAEDLLAAVDEHQPDVTVVDVRMPPGYTDEGLRAAITIRRDHPKAGVLVFSQYIETRYAADLLGAASGGGAAGVGYLLKDRVADVGGFVEALSRVAAGGTALDPEVVTQLLGASRRTDGLGSLTARERDVLALMAEGRSNGAIAGILVVSERAVEKHVGEHLQQARPGAVGRRSPPGAGRAALPGVLTGRATSPLPCSRWPLAWILPMPELSQASAATVLVACLVAAAIAFVVGVAVTALIRRLAARRGVRLERRTIWRAPFTVLLVVLAVRGVLLAAGTQREWVHRAGYILGLVAIAIVGWLLTVVAVGVERALLARYPDAGIEDRRSRHVRTKIILVTRVAQALIAAITVGAILWTIPPLRDLGAGILASAGVIGVIVGIAAQTTLGNLFAGLQIAFTDAIRIDDIVMIGTQRGRIDEITLTYVAVRQSDNTTLILPCTYFTTTPFQNWTHKGAQISGIVEISVTSSAPLDSLLGALREELGRILASSAHWDRQRGELHVEAAVGSTVKLIALVTAVNGDAIEPLRREVREGLLTFLQRDYPAALPGGSAASA